MLWRYWQHSPSGEVYAVGISSIIDGEHQQAWVEQASGPLHHSEVTKKNLRAENFNSDPGTAEWIRKNLDSFSVKEL
jgi:hypothetical protein